MVIIHKNHIIYHFLLCVLYIYIFYNIITKIFKIKTGDGIFTKIFITFYYIITKIFKKTNISEFF